MKNETIFQNAPAKNRLGLVSLPVIPPSRTGSGTCRNACGVCKFFTIVFLIYRTPSHNKNVTPPVIMPSVAPLKYAGFGPSSRIYAFTLHILAGVVLVCCVVISTLPCHTFLCELVHSPNVPKGFSLPKMVHKIGNSFH